VWLVGLMGDMRNGTTSAVMLRGRSYGEVRNRP
jgi:hypothetical protein